MADEDQNNKIQSLNGNYYSYLDFENVGIKKNYYKKKYNKSKWEKTYLPTFWFDRDFDGCTWYARDFQINKNLKQVEITLNFDNIDDYAKIFLNDELIFTHEGNRINFSINISDFINRDDNNHLVIMVKDSGGSGRVIGDIFLKEYKAADLLTSRDYEKEKADKQPDWLKDAIIYELYVRSFSDDSSFKSVSNNLSSLKALGINCIWLMPIFPVGNINKKGSLGCPYAVSDYQNVNDEFGSIFDFYNLVKEAHRLDIRIILDVVCNHSSWDNWILDNHGDWYAQDSDYHIVHPPGTDWYDVAQLDYDNTVLRDYMTNILKYWVHEFDIDGFRCDVAEMIPMDFWKNAVKQLQEIKPDLVMLAEGSHPKLFINGFHLGYSWSIRNTLYKILRLGIPATRLNMSLEKEKHQYPQNAKFMRFIENHDLDRATKKFGLEKSRIAAILAYTIPGIPMLYSGQENSETHTPSLFEKEVINWESDINKMWKFYQALICVRNRYSSLRTGEYFAVPNNKEKDVVSFIRIKKSNSALVIANVREEPQELVLDLSGFSKTKKNWERVFGECNFQNNINYIKMNIDRNQYCILIFEEKKGML